MAARCVERAAAVVAAHASASTFVSSLLRSYSHPASASRPTSHAMSLQNWPHVSRSSREELSGTSTRSVTLGSTATATPSPRGPYLRERAPLAQWGGGRAKRLAWRAPRHAVAVEGVGIGLIDGRLERPELPLPHD